MMTKKLLLIGLALATAFITKAQDVTNVTSTYIQNASFEADIISSLEAVNNSADGLRGYKVSAPKDWTVNNGANAVSLIVTKDCYSDNNFGKITTLADGSQAYYLRMGWSTGTTTVRQTISSLPKGKYRLTACVRSGYANSATSTFTMTAGSQNTTVAFSLGSTGCFTTMSWNTETLNFEQTSDGSITIGFDVTWLSGGSCVMFDHVQLYRLPDDYVEPAGPTETDVDSPTEGTILADFVGEETMQADLLQMLANFATYLKNDFQD